MFYILLLRLGEDFSHDRVKSVMLSILITVFPNHIRQKKVLIKSKDVDHIVLFLASLLGWAAESNTRSPAASKLEGTPTSQNSHKNGLVAGPLDFTNKNT